MQTYQYTQSYPVTLDNTALAVPEVFIDLSNKQRSALIKLVSLRENAFFAGFADKVNKRQKVQKRLLVITDKAVYNIDDDVSFFENIAMCHAFDGYIIRRKININKVFGATISISTGSNKQQLIVHVQGDYDYLYNGGQNRDKIIKSLMNAHFATTRNIPFELFCRDETILTKFHTTSDDLKKKIDKRPKEGKILVTREMMQNGLAWIISNRHSLLADGPNNANNGSNIPQNSQNPGQGYGGVSPNAGSNNGTSGPPQISQPNTIAQPNQAYPQGLSSNINPFQQVLNQSNQNGLHPPNENLGANPYSAGLNPPFASNNSRPPNQPTSIYPNFENYEGQWNPGNH